MIVVHHDEGTACPREVVARGGHPLGLIEYVIERVHLFLTLELHEFGQRGALP